MKRLEETVNSLVIEVEELKKRMKQVEDEIAKEKNGENGYSQSAQLNEDEKALILGESIRKILGFTFRRRESIRD